MVIVKMYMIVDYKYQEENTLWCFFLVKFLYTDVVPFLIGLNNKKHSESDIGLMLKDQRKRAASH